MSFTENAKTPITKRGGFRASRLKFSVTVRNAQGDYLFELNLTVGAFRGGLQLEIGKDRLVAPGFFYGSWSFCPMTRKGIVGERPIG